MRRTANRDGALSLRYEDLTTDPSDTAQRLLQWMPELGHVVTNAHFNIHGRPSMIENRNAAEMAHITTAMRRTYSGVFRLRASESILSFGYELHDQPPPSPPALAESVVAHNVPGIGSWSGSCTCPDGQVYQAGLFLSDPLCGVGSHLACYGGAMGACSQQNHEGAHTQVTCGAQPLPPSSHLAPAPPPLTPSPCPPLPSPPRPSRPPPSSPSAPPPIPPSPPSMCRPWCIEHIQTWGTKCNFGGCGGCPECFLFPPSPPLPPPFPPRRLPPLPASLPPVLTLERCDNLTGLALEVAACAAMQAVGVTDTDTLSKLISAFLLGLTVLCMPCAAFAVVRRVRFLTNVRTRLVDDGMDGDNDDAYSATRPPPCRPSAARSCVHSLVSPRTKVSARASEVVELQQVPSTTHSVGDIDNTQASRQAEALSQDMANRACKRSLRMSKKALLSTRGRTRGRMRLSASDAELEHIAPPALRPS